MTMTKEKLENLKRQAAELGYDFGDAKTEADVREALARAGVKDGDWRRESVSAPQSIDEEKRTVEAVIATEAPVVRFDWSRWELYKEVLPVKACRIDAIPGGEIPLLNGHQGWGDVRNQLGTTTDIHVEGDVIVGTRHFSKASHVEDIWTMVKEGHLKRQSIGYSVLKKERIAKGEKMTIGGREWQAEKNINLVVATEWRILEDSIVMLPADTNTGNRSAEPVDIPTPKQKDTTMADENTKKDTPAVDSGEATRAADAEIVQLCSRHGMADKAAEFIRDGKTVDQVRAAILDAIEKKAQADAASKPPVAPVVTVTDDQVDKNIRVLSAVLDERTGGKRGEASLDEFRGMTMKEMAAHCVRCAGDTPSYKGSKLFERAMATGDFPKILSNTAARNLMRGFDEAEETYTVWTDSTGLVNDFREHPVARGIAKFSLEEVPEGSEYGYATMGEDGDKVKVAKYGKKIAYTWEAMINDDLDQLSLIPYEFGRAARRLEGDMAYDYLTANPTLRDGVALFHATHGNLAGSGAAPSEGTVNAGIVAMATAKDNGKNIYLDPRFIIAPHALEMTISKLLYSANYNDSAPAATQFNTVRGRLTGVYDARLDAYAATLGTNLWFLAASPRNTVRFYHLAGNENVFTERIEDKDRDALVIKCRHVVGANCSYWQGLYKNAGASRA